MQQSLLYLVPGLAVLGLIVMAIQASWVRKQSTGEARMSEIAQHIHEGALAFLSAEYRILAVFVVLAGALLGLVSSMVETTHWFIVVAFVIGAVFSALAGNIGMRIATQANVRTTQAARTSLSEGLKVSSEPGNLRGSAFAPFGIANLNFLPSGRSSSSAYGLKASSPAKAYIVVSSGEVTNAYVFGLPSLRFAKLRLYDVMIVF